ncbi:LD-carboxypeptidase [Sphingobacteriaceae bacterium]|nr:LD-carboxypeptidase [Sphingobacteriaceae bacterium]
MLLAPSYLKKGDTVLIIGTARARSKDQVEPAIEILKSWGLKVEAGKHLYKKHNQFAGTDKERAHDLQWALDHISAKAILIAGGGYGTLRIIDLINFEKFKKNPKWIIGYSDTTVIQSRLTKLKVASIHGTMAFQFTKNAEATESLKKALFGEKLEYEIQKNKLNRSGSADAEVVGGNLSLLYALSGSVDDISTKNKILFIEDLDEQLYHIDRMILQLKRSGKLKDLKGLIVGGMSEMKDNAVPFGKTAEEIIKDAVKEYKYPVCFSFPAGHIENNMALYFGKKARLSITKSRIKFEYL